MTSADLNIQYSPERKNDRYDFEWAHEELSNAVSPVFLALLVFKLDGDHFAPPPPHHHGEGG